MRILFVSPYYAPAFSYGGIPRATTDQAELLAKSGNEVSVITTDVLDSKNRNTVLNEILNGVKIFRFKNFSNFLAKNLNFYTGSGVGQWAKNNISNYDIIHFADVYSFVFLKPIYKYIKKYNIPYLVQPHGTMMFDFLSKTHPLVSIRKIAMLINKDILLNARLYITATKIESKELKWYLRYKKIIEIPHGLKDTEKKYDKMNLKEKYFPNENRKILISVSRLSYIKGFDRAIKVMAELNKINNNFIYLIYGPSEKGYHQKLNNLILKENAQNYIKLMGEIYGDDKNKIISIADLFILSSYSESQGLAALESINLGVPVMVSKESYHNYFIGYKCGVESDFDNPKELAERINEILSDNNKLEELRSDTKNLISDKFSLEDYISKLEKIYKEAILDDESI